MVKRDFDAFMGDNYEKIDRISQLPACILRDILFYLPPKDEARTCVLSKSWYTHVWNSLQQRSFDFTQVPNPIARYENFYSEEGQQHFINRVNESFLTLQTESFKLATVSITFNLLEENYIFCLDRWLELAAQSNLRSLSVEVVCTGIEFIWYKIPKIALSLVVPLLKELKLTSCTLQQASLIIDNVGPLALQRLCMDKVKLENQDGIFQNFISKCTSLEYLSYYNVVGLKDLRLSNHSKLKELQVKVVEAKGFVLLERVEVVDCLSLETIRASCFRRTPIVVEFTRCKYLQHLYLEHTRVKEDDFLQNLAFNFPLLQTFSFHSFDIKGGKCVVKHSLLKTLRILKATMLDLEIDTPSLLSFTYEGTIIATTLLFLSNAPSCILDIHFGRRGDLCHQGFIQFRALLAQLHKHNVNVSFDIHSFSRAFPMDIFRKTPTLDLVCEVEILKIHFQRSVSSLDAAGVFNGVLWCCRPKKLLVIQNNLREKMELSKVIREIVTSSREDDRGCCNAYRVRCWRHYLKVTSINDIDTANNTLLEPLLQNISSYKEVVLTLSWF